MIIRPEEHDLIARLLRCPVPPRERGFLQSLVGRQTMSIPQFNWVLGIAKRHRRHLQGLKKEPRQFTSTTQGGTA